MIKIVETASPLRTCQLHDVGDSAFVFACDLSWSHLVQKSYMPVYVRLPVGDRFLAKVRAGHMLVYNLKNGCIYSRPSNSWVNLVNAELHFSIK